MLGQGINQGGGVTGVRGGWEMGGIGDWGTGRGGDGEIGKLTMVDCTRHHSLIILAKGGQDIFDIVNSDVLLLQPSQQIGHLGAPDPRKGL
jgi:hypothetical protein